MTPESPGADRQVPVNPLNPNPPTRWALAGLWIALTLIAAACTDAPPDRGSGPAGNPTPVESYTVVRSLPHDPRAFTQGLVFEDGFFYEGTGLYGASTLRRVDPETGEVLQTHSLDRRYFGEGVAVRDGRIYQLTWKSNVGFIYDRESFDRIGTFSFPSAEGWGLAWDGRNLVLSDGSSTLYFLDPETFLETRRVTVRDRGAPVARLNELEIVRGDLLANVWQTDRIARIDPESGEVKAWIDFSGLLDRSLCAGPVDVLNGIAYDAAGDRLFVTGKNWCRLFQVRLAPAR